MKKVIAISISGLFASAAYAAAPADEKAPVTPANAEKSERYVPFFYEKFG